MLLALRRWLGLGTAVVAESATALDQKPQKWVIEPARVGLIARAEELWRYRRILWFFASRRIKERYEDMTDVIAAPQRHVVADRHERLHGVVLEDEAVVARRRGREIAAP